jgi:hypothetical protein
MKIKIHFYIFYKIRVNFCINKKKDYFQTHNEIIFLKRYDYDIIEKTEVSMVKGEKYL